MRLVWLLAWRHLAFQPGRTLLSALGIGLGIATVVAVLVVDHNTLLSQAARRGLADPESDLLLQPLVRDPAAVPDQVARLRSHPWLSGVTAYAQGKRTLAVDGRPLAGVEVFAVEQAAQRDHDGWVVAQGEDLDFTRDAPQLLLSAGVAEQTGLGPGDRVVLLRPPPRLAPTTCVDGRLVAARAPAPHQLAFRGDEADATFEVRGVLAPTRLGWPRHRVLTTFEAGRALLGRELQAHYWADFDRASIDFLGVEAALRDAFVIQEPKRALAGEAPEELAFRSGVRLCGFLALFLGLYVIFNTMSMSLVERVRQIGLLRALGLTRGRLLLIFLVEGLVLAVLGALLAAGLAERIVTAMQAARLTTLGYGKPLEVREVPWAPVIAVTAAGVSFCLLGVVYPFLRASRLSVIDALRRGVIEMSRDPFTGTRRAVLLGLLGLVPVAWLVGAPGDQVAAAPLWRAFVEAVGIVVGALALLLLVPSLLPALARALLAPLRGAAAVLARRTIDAARHRVFATASGLMLVFAAVFLVASVLESLKSDTRGFTRIALADRLYLRTSVEGAARLDALRRKVPELAGLLPVNAEVFSSFLVRGLDYRALLQGSLAGERELVRRFIERPGLILSTRCADDFGYGVGDQVTLVTDGEGPVAFTVLAVTDEYGFVPDDRIYGVVSTGNMARYWCRESEGEAGWYTTRHAGTGPDDLAALRARVEAVLGEGRVGDLDLRRGDEIGAAYLAQHDRDFAIFYAILVLTVLLAAIGVLNAMVIAVMERRREIGLLRAVGLTSGQVARMLLAESGALGVLGGVLGLALGLPLAAIATGALVELSHLDLVFAVSGAALGWVLAGAVLVAVVAVLAPVLRAHRVPIAAVLRAE